METDELVTTEGLLREARSVLENFIFNIADDVELYSDNRSKEQFHYQLRMILNISRMLKQEIDEHLA